MSSSFVRVALIVAGYMFLVGCGTSGQVMVYPVKGRVTLEGKPMVGGGSISFIPTTDQKGKAAGGVINEDGTYTLSTYGDGDGSMTGDFRVVITQVTAKEPERTPDGTAPAKAAPTEVAPADRIPLTYANDRESSLTAMVEAKPNVIDFDLKRQ